MRAFRVSAGVRLIFEREVGYDHHDNFVNSRLQQLQPYPFEKLRALLAGLAPALSPIRLSIGEPQHADAGAHPPGARRDTWMVCRSIRRRRDWIALREAMAAWFERRYALSTRWMPPTQVLPVNGTREALFAFAQAVVDPSRPRPVVVCPNPFYQIYEGAAMLAGAEPVFLNQTAEQRLRPRSRLADRRTVGVARSCCTCARRAIRRAGC